MTKCGERIAAVELHAFDDFDGRLVAAAFFDRDHAVLADLRERVGQHAADRRVVVAGDRGDLLQALLVLDVDRLGLLLDRFADRLRRPCAMPRLRAIGSAPAAIILRPSRKMPSASTVAVVVPSPATSFVLLAASFTSWAPRFSNGSSSSMSSATVTPSLVTLGEPQPLSSTALRPRGPSVLRTARANFSTPAANGGPGVVIKHHLFCCHAKFLQSRWDTRCEKGPTTP